jgi:hypothetical protein
MAPTPPAMVFRARHQKFVIHLGPHRPWKGLPETGPARATVELRLPLKQGKPTACTAIDPCTLLLIQGAGEGGLGALLPQHPVGLWR